jgi:amidase
MRLVDPAVHAALLPWVGRAKSFFEESSEIDVAGAALSAWSDTFRMLSGAEAWACHGEWIEQVQPRLAPDVAARFKFAKSIDAATIAAHQKQRADISARMDTLLEPGAILCMPTAATPAPLRDADEATFDRVRQRTLMLTCIAGLAGLPQISLPAGFADDAPVGISFLAARGQDAMLLNFVKLLTIPHAAEPDNDAESQV